MDLFFDDDVGVMAKKSISLTHGVIELLLNLWPLTYTVRLQLDYSWQEFHSVKALVRWLAENTLEALYINIARSAAKSHK